MPKNTPEQQKSAIHQDFNQKATVYADKYQTYTYDTRSYHLRNQLTLAWLGTKPQRVLEAGCGPAILTAVLQQRGHRPVGIDLVEANLRAGQSRLANENPQPPLLAGDLTALPFANQTFDTIVSLGVLEYILGQQKALQEFHRVIGPQGTIILSLPNRQSLYRLWERYVYMPTSDWIKHMKGRSRPHYARQEFSKPEIIQLVTQAGFMVQEIRPFAAQVCLQPFNKLAPRLALRLAEKMETHLPQTGNTVGIEFLVRAIKQA